MIHIQIKNNHRTKLHNVETVSVVSMKKASDLAVNHDKFKLNVNGRDSGERVIDSMFLWVINTFICLSKLNNRQSELLGKVEREKGFQSEGGRQSSAL